MAKQNFLYKKISDFGPVDYLHNFLSSHFIFSRHYKLFSKQQIYCLRKNYIDNLKDLNYKYI